MIPRLDISFPLKRRLQYCFGREYEPAGGEFLLNHARSGIVLALRASLPEGGRVGVVTYNCHTVANAVVSSGCTPVFLDIDDQLRIALRVPDPYGPARLDAVVVTNLFGIRNDIDSVRKAFPGAVVIVDDAHGYGLPPEGDFTVYSINQGKYPALGEGGLLTVCNPAYLRSVQEQYDALPSYGIVRFWKLFVSMALKAFMYRPRVYGLLTVHLKAASSASADHSPVRPRKMCSGVSRMYRSYLSAHKEAPVAKPFMDIVRTDSPETVIAQYRAMGIEAQTHFRGCIRWACEFGYVQGTCPCAERLVHHLVMVPNWYK